jgi:hypothetical protein
MLRIARLLPVPRWLEKAWQETRVEAPDTMLLEAADADTLPAALLAVEEPLDLAF